MVSEDGLLENKEGEVILEAPPIELGILCSNLLYFVVGLIITNIYFLVLFHEKNDVFPGLFVLRANN